MLLKLRQVTIYLLDNLVLHPPEKFASLCSALCGDHQSADHAVDLFSLIVLFLLAQEEGLVHKVGEVRDGRDRVDIEAIDNDFVEVTAQWPLQLHCLLNICISLSRLLQLDGVVLAGIERVA